MCIHRLLLVSARLLVVRARGELMREIKAPGFFTHADLFLAGGISNTADWQVRAIEMLQPVSGTLLNPRRNATFDEIDADEQVEWEYRALRSVDAILFWFPPETLCPITLFELGVWSSQRAVPLFVGTDPAYQRRFDVVKQLSLSAPGFTVYADLAHVVDAYSLWRRSL